MRKLLTYPRSVNLKDWWRTKTANLSRLPETPQAIATGVAVGVFFGFVPLIGLKTLLSLGVTRLFRGNLVAAAVAVTLHDVVLPIAPLLLRWEYDLGYWLLSRPHELPPHLHLYHHSPAVWLHWSEIFTVGRPLLLGSSLCAGPLAIAAYYVTQWWVVHARRAARPPRIGGTDAKA